MQVRRANKGDLKEVYKLYCDGFNDGAPSLPFSEKIINDETCYVLILNNKVIGMLVAIPCWYNDIKGNQPHALTIAKEYRGKHFGLYFFKEMLKDRYSVGDKFSVMLPAYDYLYSYYSKLGFEPIQAISKIVDMDSIIKYDGEILKYEDKFKYFCCKSAIANGDYVQSNPFFIVVQKSKDNNYIRVTDCLPDDLGVIKPLVKSKIYLSSYIFLTLSNIIWIFHNSISMSGVKQEIMLLCHNVKG